MAQRGVSTCATRVHPQGAPMCTVPTHIGTRLRVLVYSMHRHMWEAYTHISCACIAGSHVGVHVGTCVAQGSEHTLCLSLVSLPSALRHSHLPVCLQGIDRSHSWVNAAYAPGGSKAVLRRAPPYCGADPRQVPSLPDVPLHVHHPTSAWAPPTFLAAAD